MKKGLPLANPAQSGLLVSGSIMQAFGNWRDTDMTLDLILVAGGPPPGANAVNLTQDWKAGTKLADAIKTSLTRAFPAFTPDIKISDNLVLAHDEPGYYDNLVQYAGYVRELSKSIIGGTYAGVRISIQDKRFIVRDGTTTTKPLQIAFNDLIGQVTWKASNIVNFTCVMRADLHIDDYVKLPPGQITTTAASLSQYRQGSVFNGVFQINNVRHVGNLRAESGDYWVSVYDASLQSPNSASA
jgi:hypothetical protein